ncbi:hypothetical protein [Cocleimonas flava]|uniref:Uncharacterized protein n=1 Tax=Cocleimonas flava TaxID=634765 RepID=A0A4R1ENC2_9GAMM|nr:hypothetical protein [Cocleimonas flava]TCJ82736.1 hypothetical protein EV695_3468 [Cocleimonas flava]
MSNEFNKFWKKMKSSKNYLKVGELKDFYSYTIWARNAFVGIWVKDENAFLISRYKVGDVPILRWEYHWDIGEPLGTAKPIQIIENCPYELKNTDDKAEEICRYLNDLEEKNPVVVGFNTLQDRRIAAIRFKQRLSGMKNWKDVEV